jgi:hypothetical protein
MKIESTISKSKTPLLNADQTIAFMNDIIVACQKVDFIPVMEVVYKYNLQHHHEIEDFIEGAHLIMDNWKEPESRNEIREVTMHDSRCIACVFGKTVKVFHIEYNVFGLIYNKEFALNLDIQQGLLMDFAWCNGFLNKKDLSELNN